MINTDQKGGCQGLLQGTVSTNSCWDWNSMLTPRVSPSVYLIIVIIIIIVVVVIIIRFFSVYTPFACTRARNVGTNKPPVMYCRDFWQGRKLSLNIIYTVIRFSLLQDYFPGLLSFKREACQGYTGLLILLRLQLLQPPNIFNFLFCTRLLSFESIIDLYL